jgi:hypothetical protein
MTPTEGVSETRAEENIWTYRERINRTLEKNA